MATVTAAEVDPEGLRADQVLTSPLFGLETTLSEQVRAELARYGELHAQQRLSAQEQEEYTRLQQEIRLKVPLPYETVPSAAPRNWCGR